MLGFSRLNRLQRITLILFVTVVANWIVVSTTGYTLLGGDLFTILLVLFLILLVLTLIPPIKQKVLWRVRNRLFVTFFLIGVLPLLLMLLIVAMLFSAMSGATIAYIAQSGLNRNLDQLEQSAAQLALDIEAGRTRDAADFPVQAAVRTQNRLLVTSGRIRQIPSWSKPGFKGIVTTAGPAYFLAAHSDAGTGENRIEVFAYRPFDDRSVASLVSGMGNMQVFRLRDIGDQPLQSVRPVFDSARIAPVRVPLFAAYGGFQLEMIRLLDSGRLDDHGVYITTSPYLVVDRMLTSTLGSAKTAAIIAILIIIGMIVAVEFVAIGSSVKLTRTLTRAIHDLHTGTKKVEAGDFSHRIPVRTKDQLNELATSFNNMTQRVEQLIVEVKEKEKLESELEIARQVQARLFPKEVPKLKTLELFGLCNPARVVSGDYYDFIQLDPRSTAIVIGDISGKGISAALLMASVQAALHAQLTMGTNGGLSTATLVARLNRQLYENTTPEKYATFYCGLYDDTSGLLAYTNAGHLAPILVRNGSLIRLESNGMVVGMFPDFPYEQQVVQLHAGDLLAAFTDGITESEDANGEQFGEQRLADLLIRNHDRPLDEIVTAVTDSLRNWTSDFDNRDDTTILLARRF